MDDLIKRLCLRLAGPTPDRLSAFGTSVTSGGSLADGATDGSSRRGFLATIGKVAVGAAAAVAGTALLTRPAEAATALHCCEGVGCPFHGCFHGMALGYTWSCAGYFCHDCFTNHGNGHYFCTYTVARAHTAPQHAAPQSYAPQSNGGYGGGGYGGGGYGEYGPYGSGSYGAPSGFFGWD